jgi:hypothetical protein
VDFGGYHADLALDASHGSLPVAYAVLPRCTGGLDEQTVSGMGYVGQ